MIENESFTRRWTKAQPIVASYLNSVVPDFHEAEDLLQEVAVVLLRKFPTYDGRRPFVGWALGVARLEMLSRRRSRARSLVSYQPRVAERLAATYEEMAPELEQRESALRDCMKTLQGRALEIVRMRYLDSLKPAEIAARLRMAAGTVRVALSRVRSSLVHCIERRLAAGGRSA